MADALVIRLPSASDAPVEWVVVDGSSAQISQSARGTLAEAAALAKARRVIALAPATSVLRLRADVPLKSMAKIRQALPFALEEQLAGDIESQHFACEKRDLAGRIPVAVVAADLIETWTSELAANGLKVDAIYAESDGLATVPSTISVLIDDQRIIIRDPDGETTVADLASMQAVLELLLDQQAAQLDDDDDEEIDNSILPVNLLVYCRADAHEQHADLWERLRMRAESLDIKLLADGALPRLAGQVLATGGVNLLQGAYAKKTEFGVHFKEWRVAASLLAGLVALLLVFQGASYWQLSRQEASLDQAAEALLRATFNSTGEISDPWNELSSRLGATSPAAIASGPGFVEALEALAIAFAETPGIRMQTLSFRSGTLDMQLVAPSVDALDQLRQLISGPGKFSAEIQSANPKNDAIEGRMQIMANGQ